MSFELRKQKGNKSQEIFERYLKSQSIEFARQGCEFWDSTDNYLNELKQRMDRVSYQIRFTPDYSVIKNEIWDIEVKSKFTIEKLAYEMYLERSKSRNVGLVVVFRNSIWFSDIRDLVLKPPEQSKWLPILPVKDDVWLCPRDLSKERYMEWKTKTGGSGCSFAYISKLKSNFSLLATFIEANEIFIKK